MGKKTSLIAGGAGFVGSHLCARLLNMGDKVICLDNLSTGRRQNIRKFLSHRNFRFIRQDVVKKLNLKIDEIYHLASLASPSHYQKDPIATWQANTLGTLNLLQLAKKHHAKFLFASTSEVYGDPLQHPQKETYFGNVNPVGVRSCYDESKRAGETLCMDYFRKFKLPVKIVRIFNTYGPRMALDDGRVVSNFIVQALLGKALTIYGSGNQTRSFMYVDDLVEGLLKVMASKNFTGPVNLGNPHEFTVIKLAQLVIKLTKSKSRIVYRPLPQDDPERRRPDIGLARRKLRWAPQVRLRQGLRKTIGYFDNCLTSVK